MAIGHASEATGQKLDALADYTLAIESHALADDEQAHALFDRGLLLDGMNRLEEAVGDYSAALALVPDFAAALNNRANAYRRLGRLADARQDYLASLAVGNPKSQYSYFGLGQIAEAQGDNVEAEALYNRALAADPHYGLAREKLALLASNQNAVLSPQVPAQTEPSSAPCQPAGRILVADQAILRPALQPSLQNPGTDSEKAPAAHGGDGMRPLQAPLERASSDVPQVQLGAWRSRGEAAQGWNQALGRAGEALKGLSPRIVAVDLPAAGRFYRLRVSVGQAGPTGFCAALAARGQDCIPARD